MKYLSFLFTSYINHTTIKFLRNNEFDNTFGKNLEEEEFSLRKVESEINWHLANKQANLFETSTKKIDFKPQDHIEYIEEDEQAILISDELRFESTNKKPNFN